MAEDYSDLGFTPHADVGFVPKQSTDRYGQPPPVTGPGKGLTKEQAASPKYTRPLPSSVVNAPPDPGMLDQIGTGLKHVGQGIYGAVTGALAPPSTPAETTAFGVLGPIGPMAVRGANAIGEGFQSEAQQIKPLARAGRTSEALGHTLAAVVPGVGPWASHLGDTMGGQAPMPPSQTVPGTTVIPPRPVEAATEMAATSLAPKVASAATKLPYAPAYLREAKAGAREGMANAENPWQNKVVGGTMGAAVGQLTGLPHGWSLGSMAGLIMPVTRDAVKGAFRGMGELRKSLGDINAAPVGPPLTPETYQDVYAPGAWDWDNMTRKMQEAPSSSIPPSVRGSGVETIPTRSTPPLKSPRVAKPSPEPQRSAPAWKTIPDRPEGTTAPPPTTPTPPASQVPKPTVETPAPAPTTAAPASTATELEQQLLDTKAYVDEHRKLPSAELPDPADQLRRKQAGEEKHWTNRREAVDRAVAGVKSAGLTKEAIAQLDVYKTLKDAGYKQRSLDPDTAKMFDEQLGIVREKPASSTNVYTTNATADVVNAPRAIPPRKGRKPR